jgi:hypothetical protein
MFKLLAIFVGFLEALYFLIRFEVELNINYVTLLELLALLVYELLSLGRISKRILYVNLFTFIDISCIIIVLINLSAKLNNQQKTK